MDEKERARRTCDFLSTLPPLLQNRLAEQRKLTAENKAPSDRVLPERYTFTKWFY